jgi:hypothetical protein
VSVPAVHAGAPVARVGGQQLPEHAAAELQQPGAEHLLSRLHAGVAAAQGLGRLSGQPCYLGRLLLGERVAEPLFSPSGAQDEPVPAAGLASQIASLTSTIRSASDANSW